MNRKSDIAEIFIGLVGGALTVCLVAGLAMALLSEFGVIK